MINLNDIRLGQWVSFTRAYSTDPHKRCGMRTGTEATPLYLGNKTTGVVIGKRSVIMSNWQRYWGLADDDQSYITGERKTMLLVAIALHLNPVLVDPADAEMMEEEGE